MKPYDWYKGVGVHWEISYFFNLRLPFTFKGVANMTSQSDTDNQAAAPTK